MKTCVPVFSRFLGDGVVGLDRVVVLSAPHTRSARNAVPGPGKPAAGRGRVRPRDDADRLEGERDPGFERDENETAMSFSACFDASVRACARGVGLTP